MFRRNTVLKLQNHAETFAALGDKTRLSLVSKLSDGDAHSISQLTEDHKLTRQAVTKHLRVLEDVGLVKSVKSGRENLFQLTPKPFKDLSSYLEVISREWDQSLSRLKSFVENDS